MEERLRVIEEYCHKHEGQTVERWKSQYQFNKRMEGDVGDMKECVIKISTNQRINTVKMGLLFVVVQTVFAAIVVAVVRMYLMP